MPELNNADAAFYMLVGVFAMLLLVGLLFKLYLFIKGFSLELSYLNKEIERTQGAERKHWIRIRRKLWLSLIPFVKY